MLGYYGVRLAHGGNIGTYWSTVASDGFHSALRLTAAFAGYVPGTRP
ncbi:hypothetical protein GXB81_05185 [Paraburkholderia sp. Ac-20336]|nr:MULTISPECIES: hypothetical protein [unclassified Paraburkholderia]MBN3802451.1 hypothetical protein [Paraburkholderia sp. Ac-20336]MBN3847416.1 hypothetical protein [Paraburkholderia sp. Ac-20342]